ncbi:MAG: SpoIIIAH-like family protein [Clostridia bacterium]|nr:SpoIIIAH-like family protein [Clostridia bacterium]MBQ3091696.1 SpoIIIAH-like family protein [Clostridia bacterium]
MTKKKGAVYSVVALMLCMAVYLNWSYNRGSSDEGYETMEDFETGKMLGEAALVDGDAAGTIENNTAGGMLSEDYFAEARLSRQQARDEAVSILNTTVLNEGADEEAAAQANAEIQVMAQAAMQESRIENRIVAKGYKECVVFVGDGGINVIISKLENGLQDSDVAKITEIVMEETGCEASAIKIIETA